MQPFARMVDAACNIAIHRKNETCTKAYRVVTEVVNQQHNDQRIINRIAEALLRSVLVSRLRGLETLEAIVMNQG